MGEPQPLPGVNVYRNAINAAVQSTAVKKGNRVYDVSPTFFLSQICEIEHEAGLNELFRLATVVELSGAHWVSTGDTGDHNRASSSAAAGNRAVFPVVISLFVECFSKLCNGSSFAAGGPPVCYFKIYGSGRSCICNGSSRHE